MTNTARVLSTKPEAKALFAPGCRVVFQALHGGLVFWQLPIYGLGGEGLPGESYGILGPASAPKP